MKGRVPVIEIIVFRLSQELTKSRFENCLITTISIKKIKITNMTLKK